MIGASPPKTTIVLDEAIARSDLVRRCGRGVRTTGYDFRDKINVSMELTSRSDQLAEVTLRSGVSTPSQTNHSSAVGRRKFMTKQGKR
jgi:hypothetical protein